MRPAICERCDWSFLLPPDRLPQRCPNCFRTTLTALSEPDDAVPVDHPPELYLPFTADSERLERSIDLFARQIWFAPPDLKPDILKKRLQRIYLPMWLVDSKVEATWQAEVGFNYEVVSHRDKFEEKQGGWVSQRITETQIRWEPRLGRLARTYHNIVAPALEEHIRLRSKLGQYDLGRAQPFQTEAISGSSVRLPNRPPADAWPEAQPAIRQAAADECRRACEADHWREFRWKPDFRQQNWTLLLLPVYVTYYLDDEKQPQALLIHGQTGHLSGVRRASMKRAQRVALIIVLAAIAIFIFSLIAAVVSFVLPRLFPLAAAGLVIALLIGLLALAPLAIVWQFNRTNRP